MESFKTRVISQGKMMVINLPKFQMFIVEVLIMLKRFNMELI